MAIQNNKPAGGKRNFNPDNIPTPPDDPNKKKSKFSIYWVYGILLVGLIVYNFMRNVATAGLEINQGYLTELIKQGDVVQDLKADKDKTGLVVVRNKYIARMYLNHDSVARKEAFYKTFLSEQDYDVLKKSPAPQVFFNIQKDEDLKKELTEFYAKQPVPHEVFPNYTEEGEYFGELIKTLLPIIVLALLFIMMLRKVGGGGPGGGGPGGIFSIGKSKATLFDKGTRVNINFGDVAGLDEAKVEVMEIVDFP